MSNRLDRRNARSTRREVHANRAIAIMSDDSLFVALWIAKFEESRAKAASRY